MNRTEGFDRVEALLLRSPRIIDALQALDTALCSPGDALTLAAPWAFLQPIADAFGESTDDYLNWLVMMRDERRSWRKAIDKTEVRHHVRTVYQRHMMRARRHRLDIARHLAEIRAGKKIEGKARVMLEASLIRSWMSQRSAAIDLAREALGRELSYDERVAAGNAFWQRLDATLESSLSALAGQSHQRQPNK